MSPPPDAADTQSFADIPAQPFDWIWPGWVPRGVLTLLDGDPDMGKSTLAIELAAHVSRGTVIQVPPPPPPAAEPDTRRRQRQSAPVVAPPPPPPPRRPPESVLLLSAEEDAARVLRPRLDAAGADIGRVFLLNHPPGHPERPVQLPQDTQALRAAVERHRVALVVIDPLMAFLGADANASRTSPAVCRA